MGFRKTVKGDDATEQVPGTATPENLETAAAETVAGLSPDAIPAPIVATDASGNERPLSGGTFIRVDGKLQRREA